MEETKPGWKSTEFWMSLAAMIIGAVLASGVITDDSVLKIIGMAASVLSALGYSTARGFTKAADSKAKALVKAVEAGAKAPNP